MNIQTIKNMTALKSTKMSWGTRIAILYGAFVMMIVFMVFRTMNEKVDLVSPDYYQNELKFQDQIDRQNQSAALSAQPSVEATEKNVAIKFPTSAKDNVSGTIKFYRPSDSSMDFTTVLQIEADGIQLVPLEKFVRGNYQVQMTWSAAGKKYYNEASLYIP